MKKFVSVFFALTALLMLAVPAHAARAVDRLTPIEPIDPLESVANEEARSDPEAPAQSTVIVRQPGRGTVADIEAYWEENGYPADVSYAFEAGGEVVDGQVIGWWEIGLVENTEARQQEILALVSPTCLVEFKKALFSHAEKLTAYEKLTELAETDENILDVIFVRNDDTVWVAISEGAEKDYAKYLIRDLGLGAVVSVTDENSLNNITDGDLIANVATPGGGLDAAIPTTGSETGAVPTARGGGPAYWICLALAAAAVCGFGALLLRRSLVPAAATAQGGVRTGSAAPLSRRQTEQAVRDSVEDPGPGVCRSVLDRAGRDDTLPKE